MSRVCHIIVAAGRGSRFGADRPKQFCNLCGRPVLMTTIDRIMECHASDDVLLVLSVDGMAIWKDLCETYRYSSPRIVLGGDSRWASVRNALAAIGGDVEIVTVHDGARPLVTTAVVDRVVAAVDAGAYGAIPVVQVTDSLRMVCGDGDSKAVDRSVMRAVQTPQAFRVRELKEAYANPYEATYTDDASVMEAAGFKPLVLVDGDVDNIKITHSRDIAIASAIIGECPSYSI